VAIRPLTAQFRLNQLGIQRLVLNMEKSEFSNHNFPRNNAGSVV